MTQIMIRVNDQTVIQTLQNFKEMTEFAIEKKLLNKEVVPSILKYTAAVSEVMKNHSLFYHLVRRSHDWGYNPPSNLDFNGLLEDKAVQKVIQISSTVFSNGKVVLIHGARINSSQYNDTLFTLQLIQEIEEQLFLNLVSLLRTPDFKLQRGVGPRLAELRLINGNEEITQMAKKILLSDTKLENNTIKICSPLVN